MPSGVLTSATCGTSTRGCCQGQPATAIWRAVCATRASWLVTTSRRPTPTRKVSAASTIKVKIRRCLRTRRTIHRMAFMTTAGGGGTLGGVQIENTSSVDARQGGARLALIGLWFLLGALMLVNIGGPDVSRTQEARVLETAREMLGSGVRGWIIP